MKTLHKIAGVILLLASLYFVIIGGAQVIDWYQWSHNQVGVKDFTNLIIGIAGLIILFKAFILSELSVEKHIRDRQEFEDFEKSVRK